MHRLGPEPSLGGFVDEVYATPAGAGQLEVWLALYAYAFQVYFDFSGYTDIAWGAAGLLGFRLPENFRHPYLAENAAEFWRRWHISLSTWLRDYIYLPLLSLTGNRTPAALAGVCLIITMTLAGLWHARRTFVPGAISRPPWRRTVWRWLGQARAHAWLRRVVTFHLVLGLRVPAGSSSRLRCAASGRRLP
jgi:D-alanyl-lipoteichoic acid acyltransferase DltB (MBOAT superfamily)